MKRNYLDFKRCIATFLILFITIFGINAVSVFADTSDYLVPLTETADYVYKSTPNPNIGYMGGEWAIIGLARSDFNASDGYFDTYIENLKKVIDERQGVLDSRKNTEYSRVILGLSAVGADAQNINGYDLTKPLLDFDKTISQGINGAIWAKIALECRAFKNNSSEISVVCKKYGDYILENQLSDGGWAFGDADNSDVDLTAMALCALASDRNDTKTNAACDKALDFLSSMQTESGGFYGWGGENDESCAQVIIALCAMNVPLDSHEFVKNGKTTLDGLLTFYKNGEFVHNSSGDGESRMSTEQSLCALAALYRMYNNKTALYDMSDVNTDEPDDSESVGLPLKNSDVRVRPRKSKVKFDDVDGIDGADKLGELAAREIINGTGGGLFEPYANITRAEFAAIMVKGLGLPLGGKAGFDDVPEGEWFYDYIATAYKYGIIKGISEIEFNPNGNLTKEESAVMIARGAALCGLNTDYDNVAARNILAAFPDYIKAADWSRQAFAFCYDKKILSDDEPEMQPQKLSQRIEIAIMLYNMLSEARLLD